MNNTRRKAITELNTRLEKLSSDLVELDEQLEFLLDEEQEYFDNMPDSLQSSERGSTAEEAIGALGYARDNLDAVVSGIDDVRENLNEALA